MASTESEPSSSYLSSYEQEPHYLAFRDRDFDIEPPEARGLLRLRGAKPIYCTYLACVENYFLASELIEHYWNESSKGPSWQHGTTPGLPTIEECVASAVRTIAPYQAIRWALAGLKPGDRWPEIPSTWTKGSGNLPESCDYNSCLREARKLVESFQGDARKVSGSLLEGSASAFVQRFDSREFSAKQGYAVWFHGKDLKKAIQMTLPRPISMDHFCNWAVERFDWRRHEDLVELARELTEPAADRS
ncbi:MAG: hypothetical protein V2A79_00370 [Planctomycetota bacterium]